MSTQISNFLLDENLVDSNKLASSSIINSKIIDGSITSSKLANDVIKSIQTVGNLIKANYNSSNQNVELTSPLEITFGFEYINDMTNSTTEDADGFRNFADIFPPEGKTIQNLVGFIPSHRDVLFDGGVNADDRLFCQWRFHDGKNSYTLNTSNVFKYRDLVEFGSIGGAVGSNCTVSVINNGIPDGTTLYNLGDAPILGQRHVVKMVVTGGPDPYYSTIGLTGNVNFNLAPAVAGETWTFSVYAKADRNTSAEIILYEANQNGLFLAPDGSAAILNLTTNWQRFSVTRTFTNPSTRFLQIRVDGPPSGFASDGTTRPTIYWQGVQVEKSSSPTFYKPSFNQGFHYEIPPTADRIRVWSGNTEQRKDEYGNNGSFNYLAFWI